MRTFETIQVTIGVDDLTMIATAPIRLPEPVPMILAPAVAAGVLRELAGRLEDLDKASRLGLGPNIALSLAGLVERDLNGEGRAT
ncbi:MAG: hypothetical protein ACYC5Y_05115 [Symbiobacteriia bacterium]